MYVIFFNYLSRDSLLTETDSPLCFFDLVFLLGRVEGGGGGGDGLADKGGGSCASFVL